MSYIDRLEYLSQQMDETLKDYDIYSVHRISPMEEDIHNALKALKIKPVSLDSCSSLDDSSGSMFSSGRNCDEVLEETYSNRSHFNH